MGAFNVAETQNATHCLHRLRHVFSRYALTALFAFAAIPASHAAMCNLDIDGNSQQDGTTDGLLVMRYLLGIRGAALVSGALGTGATRTPPADIEAYLATPCSQAGWVGQGTGRLNDTGITVGLDPVNLNQVSCTSTGANIAQQDCSKGRDANPALNDPADGVAGFSFTKISNAGMVLPVTALLGSAASDWACTYDNVTGLMWEVKTSSGRRSSEHIYTWFNTDASNNGGQTGTPNVGTCDDTGQCDTEKFARLTNVAGLCGHNDWRMPHIKELESIVNFGANGAITDTRVDTTWFPNVPTQWGFVWSGSYFAGGGPWGVDFYVGGIRGGNPSFPYPVRLVRTGK